MGITWENSQGALNFYLDGAPRATNSGFATGHVINSGGKLVLGQTQGSIGGDFDALQSFSGEIAGFNIWDSVKDKHTMNNFAKVCGSEQGNVVDWRKFGSSVYGNVARVPGASCLGECLEKEAS